MNARIGGAWHLTGITGRVHGSVWTQCLFSGSPCGRIDAIDDIQHGRVTSQDRTGRLDMKAALVMCNIRLDLNLFRRH